MTAVADPTRRAILTVAAHAKDADDCRQLLDMLGITPPKPKRKPGRPTIDYGHGHHRTYGKGCRCDACRNAHRLHFAEQRAKWAQDPAAADRAGHGKPSTYKNYSCRCEPCTKAHTANLAARRARRRTGAVLAVAGGAR